MSGSTSKSKPAPVAFTEREDEVADIQLELAREALDAFRGQAEFQQLQFLLQPDAVGELAERSDIVSSVEPEALREFTGAQLSSASAGLRRADELAALEFENIQEGFSATPEEIELIGQATDAEIAASLGDIERFTGRQLETLRSELAPQLGLRPGDTPIVDRGGLIAREGIDAAARAVSDLRGKAALARLNFPLARGAQTSAALQFQQGTALARTDAINTLQQNAIASRLALTGQIGDQGLGLATGLNLPQVQQSIKPQVGTKTKSSAGGIF